MSRGTRGTLTGLCIGASALLLSGCGVVESTLDGLGNTFSSSPSAPDPADRSLPSESAEPVIVSVKIDSDAPTASDLSVEILSPNNPQSAYEDKVELPYAQEFSVATDTFLPLRGAKVEAKAAPEATFISCSITIDGREVVTGHSEGSGAKANCEHKFRLGPS